MNEIFKALLSEAQFTHEILVSGVYDIQKANYARKGAYFQAFTNLATGLERIGKLCVILDYHIENKGAFPNLKYMKNKIGHDLNMLYETSKEMVLKYDISFQYLKNLDVKIHSDILQILSSSAKGDRYSNIDFITTKNRTSDPIKDWFQKVDCLLFFGKVSRKKQSDIDNNTQIIQRAIAQIPHSTIYTNEVGLQMDYGEASYKTGMNQAILKYRRLYIIHVIRYWAEIIKALQYKAMSQTFPEQNIPYFNEIFACFYNDDRYFLMIDTFLSIRNLTANASPLKHLSPMPPQIVL